MQNDDSTYFARRSEQEATLAAHARAPLAAAVHRRLAELYAERAAVLTMAPPVAAADPVETQSG